MLISLHSLLDRQIQNVAWPKWMDARICFHILIGIVALGPFFGSGSSRGWSPVEWGEIPSVCSSVLLSVLTINHRGLKTNQQENPKRRVLRRTGFEILIKSSEWERSFLMEFLRTCQKMFFLNSNCWFKFEFFDFNRGEHFQVTFHDLVTHSTILNP